jgi:hypothetical protein
VEITFAVSHVRKLHVFILLSHVEWQDHIVRMKSVEAPQRRKGRAILLSGFQKKCK